MQLHSVKHLHLRSDIPLETKEITDTVIDVTLDELVTDSEIVNVLL